MPVGRKFDVLLNGKGYMLLRSQTGGRSWQRAGQPDTPSVEPPRLATEFGGEPSQIDYAEVWTDWSGGFGHAYRRPKDENSYFGFLAEPNTYHWSENFDARFPHQLVHCQQMRLLDNTSYPTLNHNVLNLLDCPAPSLGGAVFAGQGGVYVSMTYGGSGAGGRLYPTGLDAAGSQFNVGVLSAIFNYGAGRPAIFGSYVYLASADDTLIYDTLDDSNNANVSGVKPGHGYAVAGNGMWGVFGLHAARDIYVQQVAANASPGHAADWSATLTVGNGMSQIRDIRSYKGQAFIGAEDGLYVGDNTATFVNVLNDLSGQAHADNCRDIAIHNGQVVVQHIDGIYAYNPTITTTGQIREIGPDLQSNRSPIVGRFRALEALGPWLYAGLWTGSQSYLLAGRDENAPDAYTWHVLNRYPHTSRPQRLHVDGITTSSGGLRQVPNRMWAATDPSIGDVSGTAPLYYWPIPPLNGNPLANPIAFSANYVGSARMDLGSVDNRAPATPKVYRSVEIQAENFASGYVYANVYYTLDGTGPRTLLGQANVSPRSVLYFPSTVGSFTTGYAIELSIESFTATQALTPIYRSMVLRSTLRPRSVDVITAVLDLADHTSDRQGAPMRPGAVQLGELRALAIQAAPVSLVDLAGATQIVEVLAPISEQEVYQAGQDNPYVAATVKMAVLSYTSG